MSFLLALFAAIVLILAGMLHEKKRKREVPVLVKRYFHPGHTWMRVTEDGDVMVGLDEFGQSLLGTIEAVTLPRLLRKVAQGGVACRLMHGKRSVPLVSPIGGRVIMKNEMVMHNPSLVNTSPYGDGWLFRVRPSRLAPQLRNLLTGRAAVQWEDAARAHLSRLFSGVPALMYQDGGVPVKDLADRCSDEEWDLIEREFFLSGDRTDKPIMETTL